MIRRPPRSTLDRSSAASDVYKRQIKIYDTFRSAIAIEATQGGFIENVLVENIVAKNTCLLYTSPSPRDRTRYRMPSSA